MPVEYSTVIFRISLLMQTTLFILRKFPEKIHLLWQKSTSGKQLTIFEKPAIIHIAVCLVTAALVFATNLFYLKKRDNG